MSDVITIPVLYVPGPEGDPGPEGPVGPSLFGGLTIVSAGTTPTLTRASAQSVVVPTGGAASGFAFPPVMQDGDVVTVKTSGAAPVVNQATIAPNGHHIEDPLNPGTTTTSSVAMGPNAGATAIYRYELTGDLLRLWS